MYPKSVMNAIDPKGLMAFFLFSRTEKSLIASRKRSRDTKFAKI